MHVTPMDCCSPLSKLMSLHDSWTWAAQDTSIALRTSKSVTLVTLCAERCFDNSRSMRSFRLGPTEEQKLACPGCHFNSWRRLVRGT